MEARREQRCPSSAFLEHSPPGRGPPAAGGCRCQESAITEIAGALRSESPDRESVKLKVGRCSDPQGLASPALGCPAGSDGAQRSAITQRSVARSRARGREGGGPRKVGAGRMRRPWGRDPPAAGRPLGREGGPRTQVGTLGKACASGAPWGPAPELRSSTRGQRGARDAGAGNSPAAEPGSAEAALRAARCAPARRRRLLLLLLLFLRLPGTGAAALAEPKPPGRQPSAAGGASRSHSPPGRSRARPSPVPLLCASPIVPHPLA